MRGLGSTALASSAAVGDRRRLARGGGGRACRPGRSGSTLGARCGRDTAGGADAPLGVQPTVARCRNRLDTGGTTHGTCVVASSDGAPGRFPLRLLPLRPLRGPSTEDARGVVGCGRHGIHGAGASRSLDRPVRRDGGGIGREWSEPFWDGPGGVARTCASARVRSDLRGQGVGTSGAGRRGPAAHAQERRGREGARVRGRGGGLRCGRRGRLPGRAYHHTDHSTARGITYGARRSGRPGRGAPVGDAARG